MNRARNSASRTQLGIRGIDDDVYVRLSGDVALATLDRQSVRFPFSQRVLLSVAETSTSADASVRDDSIAKPFGAVVVAVAIAVLIAVAVALVVAVAVAFALAVATSVAVFVTTPVAVSVGRCRCVSVALAVAVSVALALPLRGPGRCR